MKLKYEPEDFLLVLKPHLDKDLVWTGEVSVNIVTSDANKLDDEDYYGMMHFARLVCGSIPTMDKNEKFKIECEKEANLYLPSEDKCAIDKINNVDGNVITLNFKSDTEGSA
tara:strand:+ start:100 stop:435 length:336 start_codon:yes stop_codon:yes gene_type:complete